MKISLTKFQRFLLLFNIIFLASSALLFSEIKNYEFVIYGFFAVGITIAVTSLNSRFQFSNLTFAGLTILNITHQLGGGLMINNARLYALQIIPGILRFDKIVHIFGIFIITIALYELFKHHLKNIKEDWVIMIFLIFAGIGIGVLWEFVEFIPVMTLPETGVGEYMNTIGDLLSNTLGAIFSNLYKSQDILQK